MVEGLIARYCEATAAPVLWVGHDADQLDRLANRRLVIADKQLGEAR
jgi:ABC-type iron transport system FetAB ATPase subunit